MSPEQVLIRHILARHGARPDLRLWRNEVGVFWAGRPRGNTADGALVLERPSRVSAGLAVGSADLIGLTSDGRFVALECKTGSQRPTPQQAAFLELVRSWGGVAGVVRSVEDVDQVLGAPPGTGRAA